MIRSSQSVLALVVTLACSTTAQAQFTNTASNKELEQRANQTDTRINALESRLNQSLVELQRQIEASQQDLRTLRGQIEEARHELEMLRQQQRDLYADHDRRLLAIENGAAVGGLAPATGGIANPPDVVFADESAVYGEAFAAMKAGRYEEAARGFQTYLAKYPRGPRADNATYWLGEAQLMQQQYEAALKSFQAVSAFPESRRLAEAMLKVGDCQAALKAFKNARASYEKVVSTYPESEAAAQARMRIEKLNAEGR
ncbi:MAG TPA: tol-pal system protein YbgF [Steroidobacteraceae bacterium]|nr:tol-pal system protein YbgF [Steroidobacteraceae bacterium]